MPICASCGRESEGEFRFCPYCGGAARDSGALARAAQDGDGALLRRDRLDRARRVDGSGGLRALLARYFERMKGIVESHGGTVEKFIGDAVMAVFGVPVLHEDDALRACRAAVEMRDAFAGARDQRPDRR